jgi:hypothetical protein
LLEFWLRARESKLHRRTSSWGTDTRPSTAAQPIGAF